VRLNCAAGSFDRLARLAARDTCEKRTRFRAAPAASVAGRVGRRVYSDALFGLLEQVVLFFCVNSILYFASRWLYSTINDDYIGSFLP
jgi:hypothetical protein